MIVGSVSNSATVEIAFPFYTGTAGARDLGNGKLQLAFFVDKFSTVRGEGTVDAQAYGVEGSAAPSMVKGMVLVVVRPLPAVPE